MIAVLGDGSKGRGCTIFAFKEGLKCQMVSYAWAAIRTSEWGGGYDLVDYLSVAPLVGAKRTRKFWD